MTRRQRVAHRRRQREIRRDERIPAAEPHGGWVFQFRWVRTVLRKGYRYRRVLPHREMQVTTWASSGFSINQDGSVDTMSDGVWTHHDAEDPEAHDMRGAMRWAMGPSIYDMVEETLGSTAPPLDPPEGGASDRAHAARHELAGIPPP